MVNLNIKVQALLDDNNSSKQPYSVTEKSSFYFDLPNETREIMYELESKLSNPELVAQLTTIFFQLLDLTKIWEQLVRCPQSNLSENNVGMQYRNNSCRMCGSNILTTISVMEARLEQIKNAARVAPTLIPIH